MKEQAKADLARAQAGIARAEKRKAAAEEQIRLIKDGVEAAVNTQLDAGKSLAFLNSACTAGALAFAQALYVKGALDDFRFFVVVATFCFLVGAGAAASTPRALIRAKYASAERSDDAGKYMIPGEWCLKIASICFAVGALTFLWGIAVV